MAWELGRDHVLVLDHGLSQCCSAWLAKEHNLDIPPLRSEHVVVDSGVYLGPTGIEKQIRVKANLWETRLDVEENELHCS